MPDSEGHQARLVAFKQYPDALYPVRIKGKWGYINRKGELEIMPGWDHADDFQDGVAVVAKIINDKLMFGMINMQGEKVIPLQYEKLSPFSEDLAAACLNGVCGYISKSNLMAIPFTYEACGDFSDGRAFVKDKGWTIMIDNNGNTILTDQLMVSIFHPKFKHRLAPAFGADERTGFLNPEGRWGIPIQFHSAGNFSENLAWAMVQEPAPDSQYGFKIKGGYIDTTGNFIIKPEYDFGWDFSEGHAVVWKISSDKQEKIWYIIDKSGKPVLSNLHYRSMGVLKNGLIAIQNHDMEWGFMNIEGTEVIPPKYAGVSLFHNGLARMESGNAFDNKIVYINPHGEVVWKE